MTDVANLDDLALLISQQGSPKVRDYARAQAAATQSQEAEIRQLDARLDTLEGPPPPPPATKPVNLALPTLAGPAKVGVNTVCNPGSWDRPVTISFQWFYETATGELDAPIVGQTLNTYGPVDADVGGRHYCRVRATGSNGEFTDAFTAPTAVVVAADPVPPPPPPPGGSYPPAYADWADELAPPDARWVKSIPGNSNAPFPNATMTLVPDGEGGQALRVASPATGGNGALSSFYDPSGEFGKQGQRQVGEVEFRIVNQYSFIWFWEWHENAGNGINSCAIGLNPNRTIKIQVSGGQASGHQYSILDDLEVIAPGAWKKLEWDIVWSTNPTVGKFLIKVNGRVLANLSRATLLFKSSGQPDNVVIGGYSYTPPGSQGTQVIDFRKFAVGIV